MRTTLGRITVFSVLALTLGTGLFLVAAWTVDDALKYNPVLKVGAIQVPEVTAEAFLIFDQKTGTEVSSNNSGKVLPIASVTKLFTAAAFQKNADLDAATTITWSDVNTEGRAGKLNVSDEYTGRELLYPLLLESSNDAATAMLRAEPELLEIMNTEASSTGLSHTFFQDTSGLSDKNVSTAYEVFKFAHNLFDAEPHLFDITRLTQYIGTYTGWLNNNPLVHTDGYKGGKHGFTYEANRTAVVFFDEELNDGFVRTFGYVILGSDDLLADTEVLRRLVRENVRFE